MRAGSSTTFAQAISGPASLSATPACSVSTKEASFSTTGRPILGRARLRIEVLSLLANLLFLLPQLLLVEILVLRGPLRRCRRRWLAIRLKFSLVQLASPTLPTSSWASCRRLSALLRLLRLRASGLSAWRKRTPRLSPRAPNFAADLGSRGGGEENKVLGGGTFHFANAGFINGTPNVFWVEARGFGRTWP